MYIFELNFHRYHRLIRSNVIKLKNVGFGSQRPMAVCQEKSGFWPFFLFIALPSSRRVVENIIVREKVVLIVLLGINLPLITHQLVI